MIEKNGFIDVDFWILKAFIGFVIESLADDFRQRKYEALKDFGYGFYGEVVD